MSMRIKYHIKPRLQFAELNGNRILSVDIFVAESHMGEDEIKENYILWGTLDWQRGLDIWQSECIEPDTWTEVYTQMLLGMKEARKLIDGYCCGEPE